MASLAYLLQAGVTEGEQYTQVPEVVLAFLAGFCEGVNIFMHAAEDEIEAYAREGDIEFPEQAAVGYVCECEAHARDFSPFEVLAAQFNSSDSPEDVWQGYDDGVAAGARAAFWYNVGGCLAA